MLCELISYKKSTFKLHYHAHTRMALGIRDSHKYIHILQGGLKVPLEIFAKGGGGMLPRNCFFFFFKWCNQVHSECSKVHQPKTQQF